MRLLSSRGFRKAQQHFASRYDFMLCLSPAQATGKKQNQKNKQNEPKPTSAYHRSTQVKAAAAEQEH
jgi:hypothetical protein